MSSSSPVPEHIHAKTAASRATLSDASVSYVIIDCISHTSFSVEAATKCYLISDQFPPFLLDLY